MFMKTTKYIDNYRTLKINLIRLVLLVAFIYGFFQLQKSFYWFGAVIDFLILLAALYIQHDRIIVTNSTINFQTKALLPLFTENEIYSFDSIEKIEVDGIVTRKIEII